jgi:hypothetical protein
VAAAVACHLVLQRVTRAAPTSATWEPARRQWIAWACAVGLLTVSGWLAWAFLPPVLAAAALASARASSGATPAWRAPGRVLVGAAVATALAGATTGLLHWRGAELVSISLESWLASFTAGSATGTVSAASADLAVIAYELVLGSLAAWGLLRGWRRRPVDGPSAGSSGARPFEVTALGLWLVWGLALQLRPGGGVEDWLAVQVPLLLAAAAGIEELVAVGARRRLDPVARRATGQRVAVAVAVAAVLALAGALSGVHRLAGARGRDTLPPARRLAEDVAALQERPANELPLVHVVTGPRIDPVLAWYLRSARLRWVASAVVDPAAGPRIVLVSQDLPRDQVPADPVTNRYAIAIDRELVRLVEMR